MNIYFIKNRKSFFVPSLTIAILCALVSPYIFILFIILCLLLLVYFFREKFFLPASIIIFLVLTGQYLEQYRAIATISIILILALIFFKKYGFNFRTYPRIPIPLVCFVIFLILALSISSAFSIDPLSTYLSNFRLMIFFLICYFYYALINDDGTIDKYLIAIFISVLIVGISILIDISKTGFIIFLLDGIIIRYAGLYENPNYVGLLVMITIPINIAFFFRKYKHPYKVKIILSLVLVLSIVLLFVSNSRSSIVGTFLASAVTIAFINKKIFYGFIGTFVFSLVILFFLSNVQTYLTEYFRLERIGNREYFWNSGLNIISDYPYFGVGPELYDRYFFSYMPSVVSSLYGAHTWIVGRPHPHNFFLLMAAENGILGFISAIYFFIIYFYFCLKTLSMVRKDRTKEYLIIVTAIGVGIGILFRAFFEVTGIITYGFITRDLPFWILFIILIYIYQKNSLRN